MKLSIITVNYNNAKGLEETILSVINQSQKEFEYIIVDGASNTGDIDIIKKYDSHISNWISEPDTGIYNAMNKAVRLSTGDYCLFLNSGDTLYKQTTIEEIYAQDLDAEFIEGIIAFRDKPGVFHFPEKYINFSFYKFVNNNYHQASLIRRQLLLKTPYDESYRIAADMKFNIDVLIVQNCSYKQIPVIISTYEGGGRSKTVNHHDERTRLFSELIPERIIYDYDDLSFINYWPANRLYPLFYRIGHSITLYKLFLWLKRHVGKTISIDEEERLTQLLTPSKYPLQTIFRRKVK